MVKWSRREEEEVVKGEEQGAEEEEQGETRRLFRSPCPEAKVVEKNVS